MAQPRLRILLIGLIITSLLGRLEWGTDQRMFLFEGEWDVLHKLITDPLSVLHPFILLPLFGQVLLVIAIVQARPGHGLIWAGMGSLTVLLGFMAVIGLFSLNARIFLSTLPFLSLTAYTAWRLRTDKGQAIR
jgi:hypothetical protein